MLRWGMLHICNWGKDVSVTSCVDTEESAIITSSHKLFSVIIQNYLKKAVLLGDAAGRFRCWMAAACSRRLKLFGKITSGESGVLRECRQADLTEKRKA